MTQLEIDHLDTIGNMVWLHNMTTGMGVAINHAAPDRWVLELTDIDCNPPQLVGWKEFKTKAQVLDYAELCMKD
jgi:hypothetical protein